MNILLISQCNKNALTETRRILDQFAERCGDRCWQTAITQAGLETLHNMLRQTARKNTAVACYWTHGKNLTELLWIVGDKSQFNAEGRVPTNRTQRNILRADDENGWLSAYSIQILTAIAALLHDIGKANIAFQQKLKPKAKFFPDCYRHEWISARLFEAMIAGCDTDEQWLARLANWQNYIEENPDWLPNLTLIADKSDYPHNFSHFPPLAKVVLWLILSHHKLPFTQKTFGYHSDYERELREHFIFKTDVELFYRFLAPVEHWVMNQSEHPQPENFWQFKTLVMESKAWQKAMQRWANKALNHAPLRELSQLNKTINDPFLLILSRLCLIVGDHNYSSAPADRRLGDLNFFEKLLANTDKKTKQPKQALDEHLLGVCKTSARFARLLPKLAKELPHIQQHRPFTKRTNLDRFKWQNRAFELARSVQSESEQAGFFGVNMASTGCGKTLANAKMMYGLSNQDSARFTIALGLRVLTLQTGLALRQKLMLSSEQLAVLVGGSATKQLFELQNETVQSGSESVQEWFEGNEVYGMNVLESSIADEEFGTLLADNKAKKLLYAPIVSCTLDHMIQATETIRGGKHIVPLLRLLTSDLVLDEPDDFSQSDLPALSRLVHLAGMFGSKVLLSSATLTPDLISGLFNAYQAGRKIYNRHQGINPELPICCAWIDEYKQQQQKCATVKEFEQYHAQFTASRAEKLMQSPIRHKAEIIQLPPFSSVENQDINYTMLADSLIEQAITLHQRYAQQDPISKKYVSVGLIRFANIKPMIPLVETLFKTPLKTQFSDYKIHLCCYHSQQLLLLRSKLEEKLDRILNRSEPEALFSQPEIISALTQDKAVHHIFIVLGSPVTEVGRDHDYDWAIVDPSSMRSIIQLAGRVWRHRPEKIATQANILLLPTNWRGLQTKNHGSEPIFCHPGFEDKLNKLTSHKTVDLIKQEHLESITAIPRIIQPSLLQAETNLADLEHKVIGDLLNNKGINRVNAYWQENLTNRLNANLPLITPFRKNEGKWQTEIVCLPSEESYWEFMFKSSEKAWENPYFENDYLAEISYQKLNCESPWITPWLTIPLNQALSELCEQLDETDQTQVALRFATVSLQHYGKTLPIWKFNETLGFWQP
ncbi:type I-F CRISPR-associated helicase Cas3f [Actinobacillus equuli]|uniref:Helicase n=1 Tax=Actinobacillus equuli TaxID=718 RepID=A0AAX3FMC8_ACTEU|nr:type I-F CRISPR-associated helicase Cas3f [Actinobacillus equuli]AIZ78502.1 helicase [Actinobacillus equuli subsp. equuli]WGE44770.1 type I-F CRISPR-associated helicase Cas3f [Actinobacillus equuli subsp. equuli]VEE92458.1 helicase [Actinobacillus equuli]